MSVNTIPFHCGMCSKNVIRNAIECSLCKFWGHMKCANLKKKKHPVSLIRVPH